MNVKELDDDQLKWLLAKRLKELAEQEALALYYAEHENEREFKVAVIRANVARSHIAMVQSEVDRRADLQAQRERRQRLKDAVKTFSPKRGHGSY